MRPRRPSLHALTLATIIVLAVVVPLLAARLSGNLSIPHNDAWAYSRIASTFADTGSVRLVGWNNPFSVGQEITLGPLGKQIAVQQVFVAVLSAAALAMTYLLVRRDLSRGRALWATAAVAAFPGFGLLATSFMEDLPVYLAIVVTLYLGRLAIERRSWWLLALALAIGLWGFTTREQAAAAMAAILLAGLGAPDRRWRIRVLLLGGIAVVSAVALEAWRSSLPDGQPLVLSLNLHTARDVCIELFFTFGLLMLPVSLLALRRRRPSPGSVLLTLAVAAVGALFLHHSGQLLIGNYLTPQGPYPSVLTGTRTVLPDGLWELLQILAVAGGALLPVPLLRGLGRLDPTLRLFGILTAAGTVVAVGASQGTFDRFLIPLMPVAAVALLGSPVPEAERSEPPRLNRALAATSLALLCAVSLLITGAGLAFDSARWTRAQALVARGAAPTQVDAGLEWVGAHYPGPAVSATPSPARSDLPWYAKTLFPRAPECYVFAASPQRQLGRLMAIYPFRMYLIAGHGRLYLYDTGRCASG